MDAIGASVCAVDVSRSARHAVVEEDAIAEAFHVDMLHDGVRLACACRGDVDASPSGRCSSTVVAGNVSNAMLIDAVGHHVDAIVRARIYNLQVLQNIVTHRLGSSVDLKGGA